MAAPKSSPKDAQVMEAVLKDMGVTEYEPRIVNQMLEFCYREFIRFPSRDRHLVGGNRSFRGGLFSDLGLYQVVRRSQPLVC